jgi:hypothetical protein
MSKTEKSAKSGGAKLDQSSSSGLLTPGFPSQVDENATRVTAFFVFLTAIAGLYSQSWPVLAFLAYEFLARVIYGPSLSLQSLLGRVLAKRIFEAGPRLIPGAPKRFAQLIGTLFSVAALVSTIVGATLTSQILLGTLVLFSFLEWSVGFCAACYLFAQAMRIGLVPEKVCEACVVRYDSPA